ncbi:MAG: HD-GYP domain-containing protein [Lachnospiraceae bacterium]|nr:HD-GYP domain-containing protein [Lachnospiraceae bacterium]
MGIKYKVSELRPDMVLDKDIVTLQGQTLARAGDRLTRNLIARISFYSIFDVEIRPEEQVKAEEEAKKAEPPKQDNQTISYSQKLKSTGVYQTFQMDYSRNLAQMRGVFFRIQKEDHPAIDFKAILRDVSALFSQKTVLDLFDILQTMHSLDDAVYVHCLNVSLIARGIGRWMQADQETLDILTLAGYFHDIGKITIPSEVLNKTGKLTDEEFALMKQHPMNGKKLLSKIPHIDSRILYAALQHHERNDGSGYPRGLSGDEIDPVASVIAVADVYDAMTTARVYRAPLCAFQVIGAFENDGLQKYSPQVVMTFLSRLAGSYQNARVILSDGRRCKVVYIHHHKDCMSRPIVQFDNGDILDLLTQPKSLYISSIL